MHIRQVKLNDLDVIFDIERANFSETEAAGYDALKLRILETPDTFLIAEIAGEVAGYIEGPVIKSQHLTDDLFKTVVKNPITGGYIAVTSLSVSEKYQDQSVGKQLIMALKMLAKKQGRDGITLTCHDYLIGYYEKNGFINHGLSASTYGGGIWYEMVWETKN